MKVLVTGGAGYIGSIVAKQLIEADHEVIIVDNLSQGHKDAVPKGAQFVHADITKIGTIFSVQDKIEAVFHFAAFIATGESMTKPEVYWHNNTIGSLLLLDALRTLNIKKLIFSSTAAVYGDPSNIPITEEAPTQPTNTYGMTKLAVDMAITSECLAHGLAATSLRYFNVAGSYKGHGERHRTETHIIPLALAGAVNCKEFTIFGNDYPTQDGTCIRDYIHVADLAHAHLLALDNLTEGIHAIYNVGNGNGFSNLDIIETVEKVTGNPLPYTIGARREGDPATLIASSQKIRSILGWKPRKPLLEDIVGDAWEFYQSTQY